MPRVSQRRSYYFEKLYTSPTGESWSAKGLDWSPISEESALRLDSPFTEEEISKAIFQLDRDKAPGPDGFTIAVFQDCWDNEIVAERRRSGEEGIVFKIDFEKAYDHVKWDFLDQVLEKKGFSPRWRKWMSGFCPREEDLQTLKSLLLVFGHISGLKVNLDKSNIYGINLDQVHLSRLVVMLDCKASGWPILYLGLPLGGNLKACGFWDPVIERISRRLDGGKRLTYPWGKDNSYPILPYPYAMDWEGKRDHLVRWDVVCKPKAIGGWGLGFGNIFLKNLALLGKWLWRYPRECSALWHQEMGKELFWEDLWWGDQPLGTQYPRLFRVVLDKNIPISSVLVLLVSLLSSFGILKFLSKVKSFVWLMAHKKVNSNDMLQVRRPYKALSPDICILCMKHGESADHLFLHCSLTIGLWHRLFQLAKMDWVPPRSIFDMMSIKFNGLVLLRGDSSVASYEHRSNSVVWWERKREDFLG
ncbi:hypothetical protein CK203_060646 [Vitis vinifera]|uniref:Reverse transcriptase zinc-binding domain-containing protein n=1 Tax=Vitis vinifera TaxID=29760 RepID=A0A438GEE8_VITVI|nr:hypothetical protein CK203_060646 [Vitis vinifera]